MAKEFKEECNYLGKNTENSKPFHFQQQKKFKELVKMENGY